MMWRPRPVLALLGSMLFACAAFAADNLVIVTARVDSLTGRLEVTGENLMGPNGGRTPNVFLGPTALPLVDPVTRRSLTNNSKNTDHIYDTFDIGGTGGRHDGGGSPGNPGLIRIMW